MPDWTKNNIPDLTGKVYIVTGANSGVGYEVSLALAEKGGTVVMACRNLERSQQAFEAVRAAGNAVLMKLDLASLQSIRDFAAAFKSSYDRLDVLINNGGLVGSDRIETEDGFEAHFGAGHLGHFALTGLLLDTLMNTDESRIVTVGSRMHGDGAINWDDIMSKESYNRWDAYKQSKLANMLFAMELNRKLSAGGGSTKSVSVHPGLAQTNWADNNLSGFMKILGNLMSRMSYQSAATAALSPLYAAVDPAVKPGAYYGPENDTKGHPVEVQAAAAAHNEPDAKKLWSLSEELTGVTYDALQ